MDLSENFYTLRNLTGDFYSSHQDIDLIIDQVLRQGIIIPVEYKRQASNKGNHLKNIFSSLFVDGISVISKISNLKLEGRVFTLEWLNSDKKSVCKTKYTITKSTGVLDKRRASFMRSHVSYIKITQEPLELIDLSPLIQNAQNLCYTELYSFLLIILSRQKIVTDVSKICSTFNLPDSLVDQIRKKEITTDETFQIIKTNFIIPYKDLTAIIYLAQNLKSYSAWFTQGFLPDKKTHDIMKEIVSDGFFFFDKKINESILNFLKEQKSYIEELNQYRV